jgi:hypothetical protein
MTTAARTLIESIETTWDDYHQYADTAARGLSQTDDDALATLCEKSDESLAEAASEVMDWVRSRAKDLTH